jgi:signal transduction histidine kinase
MDGYPGPLGQIITNLVANALLHAFEGRETGSVLIVGRLDGDEVSLVCRDDGVGMTAAVIKRVFEPFFTTKRGRGGSGLGMHIVYSLVTGLMGGEISVDSRPDEGTEIVMKLPVQAPLSAGAETVISQDGIQR